MKSFYCTIIDINYVVRAWALYRSLEPYLENKIFGFYCIDDEAAAVLERLRPRNAWIIRHDEFVTPELAAVRSARKINEYCWTCKPAVLLHALRRDPTLDWGVYLDSDMLAFGDPDLGLIEAGDSAVVLTPHRFHPDHAQYEAPSGRFNAGYAAFANKPEGLRAVQWWLDRCIECCPAAPVGEIYADQKYFNALPALFSGVWQSPHPGLNAAPWNIENYRLDDAGGLPQVDGKPVLIYHFQALRIHGRRLYDLYPGPMRISGLPARYLYRPYIAALRAAFADLAAVSPGFRNGINPLGPLQIARHGRRLLHGLCNLAVA